MSATENTPITIAKDLLSQVKILAQHLNISQSQLIEMALEDFIENRHAHPNQNEPALQSGEGRPAINQGDIYWIPRDYPGDSEPNIVHPQVVIQDNVLNHSRIHTVVVCALTSNIRRANLPGNVLLDVGEANLPRQSVVEVSKVSTVAKTQLGEYIGSLTEQRISQILAGMRFLQRSFFAKDQKNTRMKGKTNEVDQP